MISLQHEVLVYLRALSQEESANLLNFGVLRKKLLVLCLSSVLRIVSHQELSQEDARIEAFSDGNINLL